MTGSAVPQADAAPNGVARRAGLPLAAAAAERLREMIFDGRLRPGERVPERVLCEALGVSRTPLREAFKALAAEGLLELRPRRGAVVTRLTEDGVEALFDVMAALDALAGARACECIGEVELAEIRALHAEMLLHHARGDLAAYFRLNQAIHRRIVDAAGNPVLSEVARGLAARLRRPRYQANLAADRWDAAVAEHRAIMAALEARDGPRLAALLRAHLRNTCEEIKAAIRAEAAGGERRIA